MAEHHGSFSHRTEDRRRAALWPSLFGRATLLGCSRHLTPVLVALRAACHREQAADAAAAARDRLTPELGIQLGELFAAEESGSYFGLIVRETPWLGREIASMKLEHETLLALLGRLVLAASGHESAKVVAAQAERIVLLLQAHERKEGHLLRRFLLADASAARAS